MPWGSIARKSASWTLGRQTEIGFARPLKLYGIIYSYVRPNSPPWSQSLRIQGLKDFAKRGVSDGNLAGLRSPNSLTSHSMLLRALTVHITITISLWLTRRCGDC